MKDYRALVSSKNMGMMMRGWTVLFFSCLFCYSGRAQSLAANRPQTPVPPFPYKVDSLVYQSPGDSLKYGVTLTIPQGPGPFPAIILITGSGQQDRDENILNHKPFAVLADFLSRQGYLVMRVDDRGKGFSSGDFKNSTTFDFAKDVQHHLDYLLQRKEVRSDRIGLMGHSEGAMIAPIVAAARKEVYFVILLAAPGIPIADLMAEQNEAIMRSVGKDSAAAKSYSEFFRRTMPEIAAAPDTITATSRLQSALTVWRAGENPYRVLATTGIRDSSSESFYKRQVIQQIYSPWFRTFLVFNPQPYLQQLKCRVLALNGSRDIQVLPVSNLDGVRESLKVAGNKHFQVVEIPGLNHLFQTCKFCTTMEYGLLTETFSPVALELISKWLKKEIN